MNEGMENLKESEDMLLLLEQHKKEIWEWKRKESKWLEDRVLLDGTKKLVNKLSEESQARVKQLDESLANALEINENHQRYNGKLQRRVTELEEDNKRLSKQIEDYLNKFREAGL
jgi:oligoribonuclease (3'-5' exoribonuclease)